ncbi:hypothetical protein ACQ4PT_021204 [Festuca glaucescens]
MGRLAAILVPLAYLVCVATAQQVKTTNTSSCHRLPLPNGVTGAESLDFYGKDGVYTGVSDGRVLKWGGRAAGWSTFAYNAKFRKLPLCSDSSVPSEEKESKCGRPLGVRFYRKTGELYIADAYLGLMKVGPAGGEAQVLAKEADGVPFHFVNGLAVDQATGDVYFTDSSLNFTRSHYAQALNGVYMCRHNFEIMNQHDDSGRLLKYDARTKLVTVLWANMPYPNGVALSRDGTHLVVAHTGPCEAHRYWLKGPKAGKYELFAELPGYPDNVRPDTQGGFWVALNRERQQNGTAPVPKPKHLVGVRLNADGKEVEELTAAAGVTLSEVASSNGKLWLGSVELDYIGVL